MSQLHADSLAEPIPADAHLQLMGYSSRVGAILDQIALTAASAGTADGPLDITRSAPVLKRANKVFDRLGSKTQENRVYAKEHADGSADEDVQDPFVLGARHGMRAVTQAFYDALKPARPAPKAATTAADEQTETFCQATAEALADFDFAGAWAQLGRLKQFVHTQDDAIDKQYFTGVLYALNGAVDSYRTRLEGRLAAERRLVPTAAERRELIALLFIGITRATRLQVATALGGEYQGIVSDLDERKLVSCLRVEGTPPLRVTTAGIARIYHLTGQLAGRVS